MSRGAPGVGARDAVATFVVLGGVLIAAGAGLYALMRAFAPDLRLAPSWAYALSGLYLICVVAGAVAYLAMAARSLRTAAKYGRDSIYIAMILAVLTAGWGVRGLVELSQGATLDRVFAISLLRTGGHSIAVAGDAVRVDGDISPALANDLRAALEANPNIDRLIIRSGGGLVSAGLDMADAVRGRRLDVFVPAYCASACVDVFLAGRRRVLGPDAGLGCHQAADLLTGRSIGVSGAFMALRNAPGSDQRVLARVVAQCDVTPPASIYAPPLADLIAIDAVTHIGRVRGSVESVDAFCARAPRACARRGGDLRS